VIVGYVDQIKPILNHKKSHEMLLVRDLSTLKLFYILNFGYFLSYILLTIVIEIFAQLLDVYAPKYKTVGKFWPI
jgi:hypothetical protein